MKAAAAHDLTTLLSFYADDAVSLPANEVVAHQPLGDAEVVG